MATRTVPSAGSGLVLSQTLDHVCLSTHSQKKQVQGFWATFYRKGYFAQVFTGQGGYLLVDKLHGSCWSHVPPPFAGNTDRVAPAAAMIQFSISVLTSELTPTPAPTVASRLTVSDSPPGARLLRTCFLHLPLPGTLPSPLPWQVSGDLAFYLFYIK